MSNGLIIYVPNTEDIEALRVGTDQSNGDVVVYNNINYLIKTVVDYNVYGHYQIIATRLEGQND